MQKFTKRSDGRYMCRVYIGKNVDGKKQYKTLYAKKPKDLQKKVDELRLQLNRGFDLLSQKDTFKIWADKYLENKKMAVSFRYHKTMEYSLKHYETLYNEEISKIKPYQIQDILTALATDEKKPLSKKTLTDLRNLASGIFKLAINNRVMDFNPADAVEIPKGSGKTKREAITDEQIEWIKNTPHAAQTAAMIMLYAGLRKGELLALTWSDIDLERNVITVNKAVEFFGDKPMLKPFTKTEAGMRIVSIPHVLSNYLSNVKINSLLVCSKNGSLMSLTSFRRMWESYMNVLNEKYGDFDTDITAKTKRGKTKSRFSPGGLPKKIETFTAHQLRHTYASLLYKAGIDVVTAKMQLGHADIKTTLNIYTHLDSKFQVRSMDKLNDYLAPKNDENKALF